MFAVGGGDGEVVYRMETAMAVDRALVGCPLLLRLSISPPTFPLDEALGPMPALFETSEQAEAVSRCVAAISSRSSGVPSKNPVPSYFIDVRLTVVDPVELSVKACGVGDRVVLSIIAENRRGDGVAMLLEKVHLSLL